MVETVQISVTITVEKSTMDKLSPEDILLVNAEINEVANDVFESVAATPPASRARGPRNFLYEHRGYMIPLIARGVLLDWFNGRPITWDGGEVTRWYGYDANPDRKAGNYINRRDLPFRQRILGTVVHTVMGLTPDKKP